MRRSIIGVLGVALCVLAPGSAWSQTQVTGSADCVQLKLPGSLCRKNYSPLDPDPETDAAAPSGEKPAPPVEAATPAPPLAASNREPQPDPDVSLQCDFDRPLTRTQIQLALTHCATVTAQAGGRQIRYTAPGARVLPPAPAATDSDLPKAERDKYVESIKGQVVTMLKDPDAAKFRNVAYKATPKGTAVCGLVSGKNGYGAYRAESRFVATGNMLYLFNDSDGSVPATGRLAWYQFCAEAKSPVN